MPTRKLIEVALPLEAINTASAREKSIRHGHPSTLHLWWARRPLAACRAVLFASLVDDPSSHPDRFQTEEAQQRERERLFGIIERLVKWENSTNEHVLREAREEILKHTNGNPPPVYDPFAGGGSIPLEAQRLGLEAHASDLNPVAVLINKALIEIPPRFANMPPVNPEDRNQIGADWKGAAGLAADVRYYGKWMRDEAEKRIGHLYPKVRLPKEYGDGEATVIAWLWAHTVRCPNPACGAQMPLVRTYWLSKKGKGVWVEPIVDRKSKRVHFEIRNGDSHKPTISVDNGTSAADTKGKKIRATFKCIVCNEGLAKGDYVDDEANEGRLNVMPLAIAAEAFRSRHYANFASEIADYIHTETVKLLSDTHIQTLLPTEPSRGTFASNAQGRIYGFKTFADYFTERQLVALATFSNLINAVRRQISEDASSILESKDLEEYTKSVATVLAVAVDKAVDYWSKICFWHNGAAHQKIVNTFARQAIQIEIIPI